MPDSREKMEKTLEALRKQLGTVRTGRANPDLLSRVHVDYYGSQVPLKQVASITVPESTVLALSVFDKNAVQSVEKAILSAGLNLNPQVDGTTVRIRLPELTEDRRKELVKVVKKYAEDAKVAIRNIRRDLLDELKKNKDVSEDDIKHKQTDIQKTTDHYIEKADAAAVEKEKEILHF